MSFPLTQSSIALIIIFENENFVRREKQAISVLITMYTPELSQEQRDELIDSFWSSADGLTPIHKSYKHKNLLFEYKRKITDADNLFAVSYFHVKPPTWKMPSYWVGWAD